MPWEGDDRRRRITNDTGRRRRQSDIDELTDQLLQTSSDLRETHERLEDAEGDVAALHLLVTGLLTTVGSIDGKVDILTDLCRSIDGKTGFNLTTFLATVIVPVVLALIGGYFLLKSQVPQALPGGR